MTFLCKSSDLGVISDKKILVAGNFDFNLAVAVNKLSAITSASVSYSTSFTPTWTTIDSAL